MNSWLLENFARQTQYFLMGTRISISTTAKVASMFSDTLAQESNQRMKIHTDGEFQHIGLGLCRSSHNSSVRGKVHLNKTDAQCREECESSSSCIGYSATVVGSGTCYVYGEFGRNLSDGWSESSGFGTEVSLANGLASMNCYKLL